MLHGRKRYLQILLDPARAELLDQVAEERQMRSTALIRQWVYDALEALLPASVYAAADAKDAATRAASVQRQLDGRRK